MKQAVPDGEGETLTEVGKATSEALSDHLFREIYRAAPDGILIVAINGDIRFANPQCLEMFGYEEEELVGGSIASLIPEAYRNRHRGHLREFAQSPSRRPMNAGLELYARRKDGSLMPVEISLSPAELEGVPLVIAIIRDVTEAVRLRAFGAGTLRAAENERRRIAQELHDDTAQRLAAVKMGLKRMPTSKPEKVSAVCDDLRSEVGSIARDVSRIARGLMPPELERIGVVESVRIWLRHRVGPQGPEVTLRAEPVDRFLDADQRLVLYRIVQEAVSNVVRHAQADRLRVSMVESGGVVKTTVEDDGTGFDPSHSRRGVRGLGLLGIRERAAMVGALVSIASRPGEGTRIRVAMNQRRE